MSRRRRQNSVMRCVAKHTAILVSTVLLGGLLSVTVVRFSPGFGADEEELDARLNAGSIELRRRANAEDRNVFVLYARYLVQMAHGNLGMSHTLQRPISELLKQRLPETIKSVGTGVLVAWVLGLGLAVPVAMWRAPLADGVATIATGILLAFPAAALALLFVVARAPARLVIALVILPKIFRYSRNLLVRSAALPHVLTARAKGLRNFRVFIWHIFPTAAPQLASLAGVSINLAFTTAIPVEALCDLPGIGQLAWKAALGRDLYLLVNLTMVVSLVTVAVNSAGDLLEQAIRGNQL
jgi:peptide/nickel transport system permease protein